MAENTNLFRILSIDGGGTRGLIPALILQHIEEQTGKPIAELFDLIVGTSTGGIIAACLSQPKLEGGGCAHSAKSMVEVYALPKNTSRIFKPYHNEHRDRMEKKIQEQVLRLFDKRGLPPWYQRLYQWLRGLFGKRGLHPEHEPGTPVPWYQGLWHPLYDGNGLKDYLKEFMATGQAQFRTALTPTVCTSFDIQTREAYMLRSWQAGQPGPDGQPDFTFVDAGRATAAPPVLLPIAEIPTRRAEDPTKYLVDGAMAANHPALLAYAEARQYLRSHEDKRADTDFLVVSIGTGCSKTSPIKPPGESPADFPEWGALQWLCNHLVEVMLDGPVSAMELAAQELLSPHQYFRFQPPLAGTLPDGTSYSCSSKADNYTKENVDNLKNAARWVMEKKNSELSRVIELLQSQRKEETK